MKIIKIKFSHFTTRKIWQELNQFGKIARTPSTIKKDYGQYIYGGIFHIHVKHMEVFNPI